MSGDSALATLSVRVDASSKHVVMGVAGEIDAATVGALRSALEAVDRSECTAVVVDLAGVSFMDCRGVSALLVGRRELARHSIDLHVRDPQPQVRRLLELALGGDRLEEPRDESSV